ENCLLTPCRKSARVGDRNAEVLVRIDGRVVNADFVVQMGTGAASTEAYVTDNFTAAYMLTRADRKGREVAVACNDAVSVVENHRAAVAAHIVGEVHLAISRSHYRLAYDRGNIHSGVERSFTVEWIDALTE